MSAFVPTTRQHQITARDRVRRSVRTAGRGTLYCAVLIPLSLASVLVTLAGRRGTAAAWWRWSRTRILGSTPPVPSSATPPVPLGATPPVPLGGSTPRLGRQPGFLAAVGHALLSAMLGAAAVLPLGVEVLFVLRGVLYGMVEHGPYDNSWGGPTRAGAWVVHFLVGIPMVVAAIIALVGIAAVHQRLTLALDGGRRAPWLIPVTLAIAVAGGLFFVAWLHQLPS